MRDKVLITGARAPAAIDLGRSFAAAGFEVHFADSRPGLMARWSHVARGVPRYASPTLSPEEFRRDIQKLVDALQPVLIVPVCEEAFHLAQTPGLEGRLFAPAPEVMDRLHSKAGFIALCDTLGLAAPATRRVVSRRELANVARDVEHLVFKAECSRFGADVLVGPSADELASVTPTEERPWVMQDRICGREACFYAVAVAGGLTAFGAYEAFWRMPAGIGYAFAPLEELMVVRLMEMARRLAEIVGTGQFACDLIIDADGRPWLIECNPRATSGVHLFGGRRDLADAITGQAEALVIGREPGHLGPAMWRYGLPTALAEGRLSAWAAQRRKAPDVITRNRGRAPAVGAVLDSVAYSLVALRRGCSLEQAMTHDIEWNGPGDAR